MPFIAVPACCLASQVKQTELSWPANATRILYAGTVHGLPFDAHIKAAINGGFNAISLFPGVYWQSLDAGRRPADLRALLQAQGLQVAAVEPLLSWVPGWPAPGARMLPRHLADESMLFRMADELHAKTVIVAWSRRRVLPMQQWIDAFAALCERARDHGLSILLEFLPWTGIGRLQTAEQIVTAAGQSNGGLLLDTWHHHRSGGDHSALQTCSVQHIRAIQLSDARPRAGWFMPVETLTSRRIPGEGVIDLPVWLSVLKGLHCNASLGVEVFSRQLRRLPPEEIGLQAGRSLQTVVEQAELLHTRGEHA